MNALSQTDLQTYLHQLIGEHLPPKLNSEKSGSQNPVAPGRETTTGNTRTQAKGDN